MDNYAQYLESMSGRRTWKRKIDYIRYNFGRFLQELQSGSQVLEIGPGRGELVSHLNGRGVEDIDIMDNDQCILDTVSSRYRVAGRLWAENLADIEGQLRQYDMVFAIQVLEHIPVSEYRSFLEVIDRHLKKGGRMVFVIPNGANPLSISERYFDLQHQTAFTENSLCSLPNHCGLAGYEARVEGFRIPPYTPINWLRIVVQKALHLCLFGLMLANGGTYQRILTPNLTLILTKR